MATDAEGLRLAHNGDTGADRARVLRRARVLGLDRALVNGDLRHLGLLVVCAVCAVTALLAAMGWLVWTDMLPVWVHRSAEFVGWWLILGLIVTGGWVVIVRRKPAIYERRSDPPESREPPEGRPAPPAGWPRG
jgi:hypothetical protein